MKTTILLSFIALLFVGNTCSSWAQNKLQLNLQKGVVYSQSMQSKYTTTTTVENEHMDMEVQVSCDISYEVLEVLDSSYHLEVWYETMSMSIKSPEVSMNFSSELEQENDLLSNILGAMVMEPFEVKLNKQGKVLEVKNIENLFNSALDEAGLDPIDRENIKAQLKQSFGDESLKGNIEMITAIFPKNDVAIGDKWSVKSNMKSIIEVGVTTTYELKQVTPEEYIIQGYAKTDTENNLEYIKMRDVYTNYNMSGITVSEFRINRKTGWMNSATMDQEINGIVKSKKDLKSAVLNVIKIKMKGQILMTGKAS